MSLSSPPDAPRESFSSADLPLHTPFSREVILDIANLLSPAELRALGLRLMRCGAPVGWMGALLVVEANHMPDRGDRGE